MSIEASERENINRWSLSKEGGFFESYVVHWVDPAQEIAAVFRYNLLSSKKRDPEATVWGHFFNRKEPQQNLALKETHPLTSCQVEHELFYFSIGPSAIFQAGARGDLKNSTMSWELKFLPPILSFRHLPSPFYRLKVPAIKWLAPQLAAELSGELKIREKNFSFSSAVVSQVHLWGNGLDESWVRGHCHHFKEDPEALFEGISIPVTVKGRTMNVPLLHIVYRGHSYLVRDPVAWIKSKSSTSA
ncbi:MAG: hypothetical protein HYY44_08985, partial [Deltaproteobacteria bacterium]|nr:hypothetical protein [Deltaproteobacteria bacterium]